MTLIEKTQILNNALNTFSGRYKARQLLYNRHWLKCKIKNHEVFNNAYNYFGMHY